MKPTEGAIYSPPRTGLPFLVVNFTTGGVLATPATTRLEARVIASRQRAAHGSGAAPEADEAPAPAEPPTRDAG